MEYRHFGAIGDILKHLMLCEFLYEEKPQIYCESNSAGAYYTLDNGFNKQYGIHHFYKNSIMFNEIYNSKYIQLLNKINKGNLTKYLGSPGLSMSILGDSCAEYFFADIDRESLENINSFYTAMQLKSKIILHNEDGIEGIEKFINSCSSSNIFVHLDPYNPIENNIGSKTAIHFFSELINKGIKVMLWFGYGTLDQRLLLLNKFNDIQKNTNIPLCTAETILDIINKSDISINPGVLGCGILVGNLSDSSIECLNKLGPMVEKIYEESLIENKFKGSLKFLFNKIVNKEIGTVHGRSQTTDKQPAKATMPPIKH